MKKTIIIAEAGVNHNGSLENAFLLVDKAVEAGVDFIKFQTFKASELVSKDARKAEYQIANTKDNVSSQYEMLKALELSKTDHDKLIEYCNQKKIEFFSTAFDLDSLEYLASLGLKMVKIPSGEITNLPYLRKAAQLFSEVILSTGMCNLAEINDALNVFLDSGISKDKIIILHCTTEYPTPMNDVNLNAMLTIKNEFKVAVGYSDHTLGIEVPIAAVALGAVVIEKHFTLDNKMEGPDHKASLEPAALTAMVKAIRNIELAMSGNGEKKPCESELKNMSVARKSIIAKVNIKEGDIFDESNITVKRPGTGISPMKWDSLIGTRSTRDYKPDELISK